MHMEFYDKLDEFARLHDACHLVKFPLVSHATLKSLEKGSKRKDCYTIQFEPSIQHEDFGKMVQLFSFLGEGHDCDCNFAMKMVRVCLEFNPELLLKGLKFIKIIENDHLVHQNEFVIMPEVLEMAHESSRDAHYTSIAKHVQQHAPWFLSRLIRDNAFFAYNFTGKGVTVYTLDTGVDASHPEFNTGQVHIGASFVDGPLLTSNDHGTVVASLAVGKTVGTAKEAQLVSLVVFDEAGNSKASSIIKGLDWILENGNKPAIINMSMGGPLSPLLDSAVELMISKGFHVVVAAGNEKSDATQLSPCNVREAIVVGASTEVNSRAIFSNYGDCIDIWAPGDNILGAAAFTKGFRKASGTSFAAPLVCGILAQLLEKSPQDTPAELQRKLLEMASPEVSSVGLLGSSRLLAKIQIGSKDYELVEAASRKKSAKSAKKPPVLKATNSSNQGRFPDLYHLALLGSLCWLYIY